MTPITQNSSKARSEDLVAERKDRVSTKETSKTVKVEKGPKPAIGMVVLYALPQGPSFGELRPAIITRVMEKKANLQVFTDGDGSGQGDHLPGVIWVRNACASDDGTPGTFLIPKR